MPGTIRPVTRDDLDRLAGLVRICGFPQRDAAGWDWVLFSNSDQGAEPPGWVYQHDGRIAGFLGTMASTLACDGARFRVIAGHTLVTDVDSPNVRAGIQLVRHALTRPGIDAFVTLNNNPLSARILPRVGLTPWLGEAGQAWHEWITHPVRFGAHAVRAQLTRRGLPGLTWPGRQVLEGRAGAVLSLGSGWPEAAIPLDDVPADARAAFYTAATSGPAPVRALSDDDLAWRRADPWRHSGRAWRAWMADGAMQGLIGAVVAKMEPDGAEALDVVELVTVPGAAGVRAGQGLLRGALAASRRARLARMRLRFGLLRDPAMLAGLPRALVRRQDYHSCHARFATDDPRLTEAWRPQPGDADLFFSLRVPPALSR